VKYIIVQFHVTRNTDCVRGRMDPQSSYAVSAALTISVV